MITVKPWTDNAGTKWFGLFGEGKTIPAAIFMIEADANRMARKINESRKPVSTGDIDHWKGLSA